MNAMTKKRTTSKKDRHKDRRAGKALREAAKTGFMQRRHQVCRRAEDAWTAIETGGEQAAPKLRKDDLRDKLLSKDNRAEERVCSMLDKLGMTYTRELRVKSERRVYYVDVVVDVDGVGPIGIEIDGSQHFTGKGQREDRGREWAILRTGDVVGILRMDWATTMRITHGTLKAWIQNIPNGGVLLMY